MYAKLCVWLAKCGYGTRMLYENIKINLELKSILRLYKSYVARYVFKCLRYATIHILLKRAFSLERFYNVNQGK